MTKKIIVTIIIFIAVISGGYYVYDSMFPVAKPIQCPSIEDISSINVSTGDNKESKILGTDFARIIIYISNSKPTRIMSVNDFPVVRPSYKIEVSTGEKTFNYYVYENKNKVYVERPYEGIYIIDSQVINIVSMPAV